MSLSIFLQSSSYAISRHLACNKLHDSGIDELIVEWAPIHNKYIPLKINTLLLNACRALLDQSIRHFGISVRHYRNRYYGFDILGLDTLGATQHHLVTTNIMDLSLPSQARPD